MDGLYLPKTPPPHPTPPTVQWHALIWWKPRMSTALPAHESTTLIAAGRKFSPSSFLDHKANRIFLQACFSARFCHFFFTVGSLRDEEDSLCLHFLIGCRALKYSSWNEKQIKAFLTLDWKWATNPWAVLLLQLCKHHICFFFIPPPHLSGITVYVCAQIHSGWMGLKTFFADDLL